MAVQAAPLPPLHHQPFVPFGFPTADFGALAEKSYGYPDGGGGLLRLEGVVGAEGDGGGGRGGGVVVVGDLCPEGSDSREATRELLSFIDSASSNIKLALDKPGKSKRKVNHRKYLQKQIKRCTGLIGGGNPENLGPAAAPANKPASTPTSSAAPPPCKAPPPPPPNRESKSLAALFDSWRSAGAASTAAASTALAAASPPPPAGPGNQEAASSPSVPVACKKLPLRDRNLPRSFFTEPAPNPPPNPAGLQGAVPSGVTEELFDLLTAPDYRALLQESTEPQPPPPAVFPGSSVLQPAEPPLYEPLPSLAPLLYAESPLRPLPALYAAVAAAAAAAAVSDHPATPPFFADCPTAVPYDYGYSRGAPYSNL